jgi:hypothetical protein
MYKRSQFVREDELRGRRVNEIKLIYTYTHQLIRRRRTCLYKRSQFVREDELRGRRVNEIKLIYTYTHQLIRRRRTGLYKQSQFTRFQRETLNSNF